MKSLKRTFIFAFLFVAVISACKKEKSDAELRKEEQDKLQKYLSTNGITQSPVNGIYYLPSKMGWGDSIKDGEYIMLDITYFGLDGNVYETSDKELAQSIGIYNSHLIYGQMRTLIDTNSTYDKGIMRGLTMIKGGSEATFIIPSDLAFKNIGSGNIPSFTTIICKVKVGDVIKNLQEYEKLLIARYVQDNNITTDSTASGLYYIETITGNSPLITNGSSVYLTLVTKYLDGREIDNVTANYVIGNSTLIEGLVQGLKKMRDGGRATLILPSKLAYNTQTISNGFQYVIFPYTPLLVEVTVNKVIF